LLAIVYLLVYVPSHEESDRYIIRFQFG
jgi:hypothetical protein